MTRYVIAIDEEGVARLRQTVSVTHGPVDGTYVVRPLPDPLQVDLVTRLALLRAVLALLQPALEAEPAPQLPAKEEAP